ncbi:zinc finger lsd1 subclass family protein, putative, partial [Ichthyophthirius multifiliis]
LNTHFSPQDAIDCGFNVYTPVGKTITYICGPKTVLGGFEICGNNCVISLNVKSNKPVYKYSFNFQYVMIDHWDFKREFLYFKINGSLAAKLQKVFTFQILCARKHLKEKYQQADFDFQTNDTLLDITITNEIFINNDAFLKSFGITEFEIYAFECMPQCAKCNNDTSCSSCFDGQYLNIDNCQNCGIAQCQKCTDGISCDLCEIGYFYNDSQCISSCPKKKYADASTRTCQDCNSKCATCSNATDCDTCFKNRVGTTCECPAYSYDNLNYTQACIECSTISIGCSTCNATKCQACLSTHFLDGNSCVTACPAGKWGNTTNRQCTACLFKCATCSNATDCDTCFENRLTQQCNCPQYSYDPNIFNQACTLCSTFSTGCVTCSKTECLTCKIPQ